MISIFTLNYDWNVAILSVHNWIDFNSSIWCFKPTNQTCIIDFQIENEKEAAACFENVARFATGKDDNRIFNNSCAFDVKVFDINVFLENKLPI